MTVAGQNAVRLFEWQAPIDFLLAPGFFLFFSLHSLKTLKRGPIFLPLLEQLSPPLQVCCSRIFGLWTIILAQLFAPTMPLTLMNVVLWYAKIDLKDVG